MLKLLLSLSLSTFNFLSLIFCLETILVFVDRLFFNFLPLPFNTSFYRKPKPLLYDSFILLVVSLKLHRVWLFVLHLIHQQMKFSFVYLFLSSFFSLVHFLFFAFVFIICKESIYWNPGPSFQNLSFDLFQRAEFLILLACKYFFQRNFFVTCLLSLSLLILVNVFPF